MESPSEKSEASWIEMDGHSENLRVLWVKIVGCRTQCSCV